ncbi:hypothetical protein [Roseibium sp. RKSG952]|uniref:hypothetical protein n=1 Tax=Roseibium sp. RKSG952 TaxID=2529384 RepID=UPI0012BD563A|nr:hypothetical protein [Roseibium sp. RKSG952]MTH96556.1 hypothetical protein [Roseibium sp. RKSG952]
MTLRLIAISFGAMNKCPYLQVFEGGAALAADDPIRWLLRPELRLVWDRDALEDAAAEPAGKCERDGHLHPALESPF